MKLKTALLKEFKEKFVNQAPSKYDFEGGHVNDYVEEDAKDLVCNRKL